MASNGDTVVVKTIVRLERLNNSKDGNPRFKVHFDDGTSALTQTDAAVNYGLENPEYKDVLVKFTMTSAGRIRYAEVIDPKAATEQLRQWVLNDQPMGLHGKLVQIAEEGDVDKLREFIIRKLRIASRDSYTGSVSEELPEAKLALIDWDLIHKVLTDN
jgi:hypothetical protein